MKHTLVFVAMIGLMGCQAESPAVQSNTYQITETPTTLDIVARDAQQHELGTVTLTTGVYADLMDGHEIDGIRLLVSAGGRTNTHISGGDHMRLLPLPFDEARVQLVTADVVQAALARHLISYEAQSVSDTATAAPAADEAAYILTSCTTALRASSSPYLCRPTCTYTTTAACGATSCSEWNISSGLSGEFVICGASQTVVTRKCTFPNDPSNPCGQAGPGGCAVCGADALVGPAASCRGDYLVSPDYCLWKESVPT